MTDPEVELVTWKRESNREYDKEGGRFTYYLAGMRGTVQFVYARYADDQVSKILGKEEMAMDLGYHSPRPLYSGHRAMSEPGECDAFRGPLRNATCYYDGSTMNAEPVLELLHRSGEDAVWEYLRQYYFDIFYDEAYEQDFEGEPYRTPDEMQAEMLANIKALNELNPDPEMTALIESMEKGK